MNVLKRLTSKELLKKVPWAGNSFRYRLNLDRLDPDSIYRAANREKTSRNVSSSELYQALLIFSRGHKKPKFIDTGAYTQYAQAIGGLYRHAIDTVYGAASSQQEISYWRKNLLDYASQLEAHLNGIHAILDTDKIWDSDSSPEFLLGIEGLPDVSVLKDMAEKAIKENRK